MLKMMMMVVVEDTRVRLLLPGHDCLSEALSLLPWLPLLLLFRLFVRVAYGRWGGWITD